MHELAVRSRQDEQMDSVGLDSETYGRVLADLSRVNRWTFTASPVLAYLRRAAAAHAAHIASSTNEWELSTER